MDHKRSAGIVLFAVLLAGCGQAPPQTEPPITVPTAVPSSASEKAKQLWEKTEESVRDFSQVRTFKIKSVDSVAQSIKASDKMTYRIDLPIITPDGVLSPNEIYPKLKKGQTITVHAVGLPKDHYVIWRITDW